MTAVEHLIRGDNLVNKVGGAVQTEGLSDEERLERNIEIGKAERDEQVRARLLAEQNRAQIALNVEEARNANFFIAGWRPAVGWVGVIALFYQFVLYPLLLWLPVRNPPEPLDYTMLYTLITGMLGVAGLRSFDKLKHTDTRRLGQ